MVDLISIFRQEDTFDLGVAGCIEQTDLDLGGMRRKQREIDALAVPMGPYRKGNAFADDVFELSGHSSCP
jgi:hypothetical protein